MNTTSGADIKARRQALGWSREKLAEMTGSHPQTINKIERGRTKHSRFTLPIKQALGMITTPESAGNVLPIRNDDKETVRPSATLRCFYGSTVEPEESVVMSRIMLRGEHQKLVDWPPFLEETDSAYAVYVPDDTMSPAYEPGDTIYLDTDLPPELDKDVLLRTGNGGGMAVLARLTGITPRGWKVKQHGNKKKVEFPVSKNEYPVCHRVVGKKNR